MALNTFLFLIPDLFEKDIRTTVTDPSMNILKTTSPLSNPLPKPNVTNIMSMNNSKDALITSENKNRLDYLVYSPPEGPKDLMHGRDCAISKCMFRL